MFGLYDEEKDLPPFLLISYISMVSSHLENLKSYHDVFVFTVCSKERKVHHFICAFLVH